MRLEPVFLVAPEPERPSDPLIPRRRFIAAVTGAGLLGLATGALWSWRPDHEPEGDGAATDDRLAWALDLQAGPLVELIRHRLAFIWVVESRPDARLVEGLRRLSVAVLEDDPALRGDRLDFAAELARTIAGFEHARSLDRLLGPLQRLR